MELFVQALIAVLVVVAVIVAAFAAFSLFGRGVPVSSINETQARTVILSDLAAHAQNADIAIINASQSAAHPGSWSITARTIYNPDSPCPAVILQSFDYPATGLLNVTEVYSNYSSGACRVYAAFNGKGGVIDNIVSIPALAVAMPYNESYAPLLSYISKYGYANIHATASRYSNLTAGNQSFDNVWLINYTTSDPSSAYHIVMDYSGSVLYGYTG